MVLSDFNVPAGPPPQAVLNQKLLWQVLCVLLFLLFVLCLLGVDISGALLSGLMLWVACIMLRDGMHEMSRYALVFGILCCLNFFFDMLPLLTEISGRIQSNTTAQTEVGPNGQPEIVYTVTTKKTPLFDWHLGFVYNVQSLTMFVAPITYALGIYLAFSAHAEIQRLFPFDEYAAAGMVRGNVMRQHLAASGIDEDTLDVSSGPPETSGAPGPRHQPETITHFQGRSYKLEPPDS
jgi:hypothetical protein